MTRLSACLFWLLASLPALAQAPATGVELEDPSALLTAARAFNGLNDDGLKPWHWKASYELFDDQGAPMGKGIFEEWWLSKYEWKATYTGDHFSGTEYRSAQGRLQAASPPRPERFLQSALVSPIRDPGNKKQSFEKPGVVQTASHLSCVTLTQEPGLEFVTSANAYCVEAGTSQLRVAKEHWLTTIYPHCGLFQGRSVGTEALLQADNHTIAKVHTESLVVMTVQDAQAAIAPPGDHAGRWMSNEEMSEVKPPRVKSSKDPVYPLAERESHTPGLVIFMFTVGEAGEIIDPHVLASTAPGFVEQARKALRSYAFYPAELKGRPVPVMIQLQIAFHVR